MASLNSLNRVTLVGNIGNFEVRTMQDGREMANLSVATTDSWKDKTSGEWRNTTEWHRIKVFSQVHVNAIKNKARVGSRVMVEGSLRTRKAVDPNSNTEKYYTDIVLQGLESILIFWDKADKSGGDNHDNQDNHDLLGDFNFETGSGSGGRGQGGGGASGGGNKPGGLPIDDLIDDDIPF